MTVSTEVDHNEYTGNGVTTSFPYTFRIFHKSDLVVQVVDLNENITDLVLDTDYTVTGAGGYAGGNVILTTALENGFRISIARELPVTQETDLRNQGKFFAEVHEDAFDKLTMLIQQVRSLFGLALRKPSFVANYYDAIGNYIRNLRDPSRPQDAATKNYVDSLASINLSRTLRTPEPIPELPGVEQRKNKIVAMDDSGNPMMVLPESGSAADVLIELAKPNGVDLVGGAASITFVNDSIASAKDEITNNLASGFSSCADIARNLAYGGSQIIDVFGDSTMWGANPSGVTQRNPINPPKVLNDTLIALYGYIVTVNNKAISGTTLHQMLTGTDGSGKTFEQRVIESSAIVIYCNHAINDSNLSADITQYRNDWVEFVRIVRKYGKVPVIITPNPNPIVNYTKVASSKRLNHYANVQRDVAKALKVDLVDNYEYFMRSLPMYHQSYLVPDGAHPTTTGYIMAGQNMAIPLVSAPTLRRAGDVCTLTDVSYFDNFTNKTFDNSGPRTGTTLLATMPAGGGQGINFPVILEYPTSDTVMGIIGLQSSDGTKVNLSFNGGAFGAAGITFYSGNIQQHDSRVAGKYNGMFLPETCALPAGLHVIGLSFAGDADVGKYLGFGGFCLVDRQQYCTSEYQIYDPIVPGTSVVGRFDWSASGNKLRFSSKDGNIEVFSISNNGSAIVATVDGADTVIASGSGDVYDYLIHFTQVGVSLRVGTVSKDIPLSIPLPDMYIPAGSGMFMKTLVVQ